LYTATDVVEKVKLIGSEGSEVLNFNSTF